MEPGMRVLGARGNTCSVRAKCARISATDGGGAEDHSTHDRG